MKGNCVTGVDSRLLVPTCLVYGIMECWWWWWCLTVPVFSIRSGFVTVGYVTDGIYTTLLLAHMNSIVVNIKLFFSRSMGV